MIITVLIIIISIYCFYIFYKIILYYIQRKRLEPLFENLTFYTDLFLKKLKRSKHVDEKSIQKLIKVSKGRNKLTPDMFEDFPETVKNIIIINYILTIGYVQYD